MLHQSGNEVLLIDGWAEHVQQIKEHGLQANFNGKEVEAKLPIVLQSEVEKEDQVDLIILFHQSDAAGKKMLQDIQSLIKKDTEVLCLLNGIGHEDIIEKFVPWKISILEIPCGRQVLKVLVRSNYLESGSVELQNLGDGKEAAAKKLADKLSESGLNAHFF